MKVTVALLVLAFALGTDARRPPPRRFPPPSPPPPSPSPPPPPSPSPPPPPSPRPPSPSPPPPPSPPSFYAFPHTCAPGNNAGLSCTPYVVDFASHSGNTLTYTVSAKDVTRTCPPQRGEACGTMNLGDVKFAINRACWGAVSGISVTDSRSTYTRSAVYAKEPNAQGAYTTFRVVFPFPYTTSNVTDLSIAVTLRAGACADPAVFFDTPDTFSGAQYAYYSPSKFCCGTSLTTFA